MKEGTLNGRRHIPGEKTSISRSPKRAPLRVAVIAEDLRLPLDEGAKKASLSLICSFTKKGVELSVFTWYENTMLKNVFPLPHNKLLLGYSFARKLKAKAPDVILYIPVSSGTVGAFVRAAVIKIQSLRIPLALLNLQYRKLPAYTRYFRLYRYTDIVFTQSQASTDVFRSFGCKTILLPGGVDHTIFHPVNREEKHLLRMNYGFQDEDRIILHIGHCHRDRNVTFLTRLMDSGLKVILIVSTSTSADQDLLTELRQSGVIVITEFIESIQHYYQLADCYLFPVINAKSAIDAPLSVLEAMACNLPVVTTQFGALPDMFESGDGFYYGGTDEELISLVKRAIVAPDCRTAEKVIPYTWGRVALTILETLKEAGI